MEWLRVAGTGQSHPGEAVTWSVAEGRRGRRWREVVARKGTVVHSLLLELDPEGRFAHLELSTAAGLLTLHPEGDGTLHGNAVTTAGIDHVRGLPWEPDDVILIVGSVVCRVVAGQLAGRQSVRVEPDLSLTRERATFAAAPIDDHGLPALEDSQQWPLEEG